MRLKLVKGDLVLIEDLVLNEDLRVEGSIIGKNGQRFSITAKNITALHINVGDINARHINAKNINAGNITAWNINAWNINAVKIDARHINAWNINAWNITARNVDYYAVCFAYANITCTSIKGSRENCKHFVLDGEIMIRNGVMKTETDEVCRFG